MDKLSTPIAYTEIEGGVVCNWPYKLLSSVELKKLYSFIDSTNTPMKDEYITFMGIRFYSLHFVDGTMWDITNGWLHEAYPHGPGSKIAESDPHGKNPHEPGAKLDAGKLRPGLVLTAFSGALTEVTKVGTYGANKYTDNGWVSVPDGRKRYLDAMYRHLLASARENTDPDTGLSHIAHAAWNILAVVELNLRERKELDDAIKSTAEDLKQSISKLI